MYRIVRAADRDSQSRMRMPYERGWMLSKSDRGTVSTVCLLAGNSYKPKAFQTTRFAMKYKPTKMPIAKAFAEQKEWGLAIVFGFIEGAVAVNESKRGNDLWCCGKCASPITLRMGAPPKVCSKCGNEVDWVGIKTRVIKICPTCNTQGALGDSFCPSHSPAVKLIDKEIPL